MYKKVLYALDIDSKPYLLKAIALADQLNAELFVGYATNLDEQLFSDDAYLGNTVGDDIVNTEKAELESKIQALITDTTINRDHVCIVNGPVGMAIERLATNLSVDLVVMANSHHYFSFLSKNALLIKLATHHDFLSLS
ncbi:universal stress protein [Photobacterium carnosum]|uniref:UspA domain-containing protein n=1 Tax=Photobacterium carnosum TaxID=2023717 RepID=A0A2N4UTW3_9GAMM|nr:universal stress protein [Photobacterium carnosum]KAE8177040.1 hypothetical protein CIT27_10340 [Photobacterium carnosum]MCD9494549.1 hypothetical protein [Photobacterium carnosum]MCD9499329.1 hypothetical protein [Photobacterium carnosum]MCD9514181.1 hypothetical protein [Photobacterium carnosum]MCD9526417.1 hypothetical protein [Photobacterium carnosum]